MWENECGWMDTQIVLVSKYQEVGFLDGESIQVDVSVSCLLRVYQSVSCVHASQVW